MPHKKCKHYGLLGHPLGHSLSPLVHELLMDYGGIRGRYHLYDIAPPHLEAGLARLLKHLDGFNCTIPYKEAIIAYLSSKADSAKLYGAVNTVFAGRGYNTDGLGFEAAGVPMQGRSVLVRGAGGVARVLTLGAARAQAAKVAIMARNKEQGQSLARDLQAAGYEAVTSPASPQAGQVYDVLLNGTPLGMWPLAGELAMTENDIKQARAIFDTVYNPSATRLVLRAKSRGIWAEGGLKMLLEQALAAQRIWNPQADFNLSKEEKASILGRMARALLHQNPLKLIITGFMGSGKTTVGRLLSAKMAGHLPFTDLDDKIISETGKTIPQIFKNEGEAGFRGHEWRLLRAELAAPGSRVIAVGAGALMHPCAETALRAAGAPIIFLEAAFDLALRRIRGDENRPLLQQDAGSIKALYNERQAVYQTLADLTLAAKQDADKIADTIMTTFLWA